MRRRRLLSVGPLTGDMTDGRAALPAGPGKSIPGGGALRGNPASGRRLGNVAPGSPCQSPADAIETSSA